MRVIAVDAHTDDNSVVRALATAAQLAANVPSVVWLYGLAPVVAQRAGLLADAGPPPAQAKLPGACAVDGAASCLELLGAHVVMGVASQEAILNGERGNARLWIVGGQRDPALADDAGSLIATPGDCADAGLVLVCEQRGRDLMVVRYDRSGARVDERVVPAVGPSVSVQGASR